MGKLHKSPQFIIGTATIILTLFFGWGLPMLVPSTPHNGIILTVIGIAISTPLFIRAYRIYRQANEALKKLVGVSFYRKDNYCFEYKDEVNLFYRLCISNPNRLRAKDMEVILTKCLRVTVDNQITEIPIRPDCLKPLGHNKNGVFEIGGDDKRYINIAHLYHDFEEAISIPYAQSDSGGITSLPLLPQGNFYKLELLVKGSNIKTLKCTVHIERPSNYFELGIKVEEANAV